jgi:hypothetical protein
MNRLFPAALFSAAALMAQFPGQAQQPYQQGPQDDPPSRVARLNWITGDIAFQPATLDTWTEATVNYPLTTGDHLYVNAGARAELHIDENVIRLNGNSGFGFLNLDDSIAQMSLSEGSLEIRLRYLDPNDIFEIDTPNGAVTLLRAGEYRVDVNPYANNTAVTVHDGQAEMYRDGDSLLITRRQTAWFRDGRDPQLSPEQLNDAFDRFAALRNDAEDALPRRDYVPELMIGSEDLYAYGRWGNDPSYGNVWYPPVDAAWAPYSTGRWAFIEPWGWTWIDEAPWGFAPFHYGRWVMLPGGWAWIPGSPGYRPVYAPALVSFIGGGGFGLSIGWFPLGPREPWIPAWGASRAYINRVNVMQVTNISSVNVNVTGIGYVNREHVTAVSREDFTAARAVRAGTIRVTQGQLQSAQMLGTSPRLAPVTNSVAIGPARQRPPAAVRAVVARTPPPPAAVSFQARQQILSENNGVPLNRNQVNQLRGQEAATVVPRANVRAIGQPAPEQPSRPYPPVPGATAPATGPQSPNRIPDRMNARPGTIPSDPRFPDPRLQQSQQPAPANPTTPPPQVMRPPGPNGPPPQVMRPEIPSQQPAPSPSYQPRPAAPPAPPMPQAFPMPQAPAQPRPPQVQAPPAPAAPQPGAPPAPGTPPRPRNPRATPEDDKK